MIYSANVGYYADCPVCVGAGPNKIMFFPDVEALVRWIFANFGEYEFTEAMRIDSAVYVISHNINRHHNVVSIELKFYKGEKGYNVWCVEDEVSPFSFTIARHPQTHDVAILYHTNWMQLDDILPELVEWESQQKGKNDEN